MVPEVLITDWTKRYANKGDFGRPCFIGATLPDTAGCSEADSELFLILVPALYNKLRKPMGVTTTWWVASTPDLVTLGIDKINF